MRELIEQLDKLESKLNKLTVLEGAAGVNLQSTYPGTADTGNINVSGNINAGTALYIGGVQVLGQGTSFPGSPSTSQRFFRTDRGLEYYYNGTRWLTTQRIILPLTYNPNGANFSPLSATASAVLAGNAPDDTMALYVEKLLMRAQVNTTLDATNNWTLELFRQNSAVGNISLGTVNTYQVGRTAGTPYQNVITVNTALSAATDAFLFFITITKNASPGTLAYGSAVLQARFIG